MADAVFSACFLNECLRHCNTVGMANFAPAVNTRGCIFAHPAGIVLRPTYHVFDLFTNRMGDTVVDSWIESDDAFEAAPDGKTVRVAALDAAATLDSPTDRLCVSIVNRHPDRGVSVEIDAGPYAPVALHVLAGVNKDACNTLARPHDVHREERKPGRNSVEAEPHSVNILVLERK